MHTLIRNSTIVNKGNIYHSDVLICDERIEKIQKNIEILPQYKTIDAMGLLLIPGMIDSHVHFREPGFTYKATIESESRAAIAGGVTSFMEMPNTLPNATRMDWLEEKYSLASASSYANYSFYFGINSSNLEEALKLDNTRVCGITDDGLYFDNKDSLLCNNTDFLEKLFSKSKSLIALHCEDEEMIGKKEAHFRNIYGDHIPARCHAEIRNDQACFTATKRVVAIAKKHQARLHVCHLSSQTETDLFEAAQDPATKRITTEACVHHLYFNEQSYEKKGMLIKWNPSVKTENDRQGLIRALKNKKIDNIATDHAPHTMSEKDTDYFSCKSGAPSIQQALPALFELYRRGELTLEEIVEKTSHNPAGIFKVKDRGFIEEGFFADVVLVDLNKRNIVRKEELLYKCGWSPFENETLFGCIHTVMVNGTTVLEAGKFTGNKNSKRLTFNNH